MTRKTVLIGLAMATSLLCAQGAWAQLFGERTLGRSVSRQAAPAAAGRTTAARTTAARTTPAAKPAPGEGTASLMSEEARFVRGNRTTSDFVGAGSVDTRRFVGSEQAGADAEEIRSAIDESVGQLTADANQTADAVTAPRVPMNAPRLRIGFEFASETPTVVNERLTRCLEAASVRVGTSRIEVSVAGGEAILRGEVPSARDRKLAELLMRFEPGIVSVQNQLVVRPADPPAPAAPQVPD